MGRPISKRRIAGRGEDDGSGNLTGGGITDGTTPTGRVRVSTYFIPTQSEAESSATPAWIIGQRSTNKFLVTTEPTAASRVTNTNTAVLTLVDNNDSTALNSGEFTINAVLDDSTVVQVTKLRNRTIQINDGTDPSTTTNIGYELEGVDFNDNTDGRAAIDTV